MLLMSFDALSQRSQEFRPAAVLLAKPFIRQARVCDTDCGDPVLLLQVKTNQCLHRVALPTGQPGKSKYPRALDLTVNALNGKRHPANTDAAHEPFAFGSQVRLHMRSLETTLTAPPLHSLLRFSQCGEHPLSASI